MAKEATHMPMSDAVVLLKERWSAVSIREGFRTAQLRAYLLVDGEAKVPIPATHWTDWRVGQSCPKTLQLGDIGGAIGNDISLMRKAVGSNNPLQFLTQLQVLHSYFENYISNPSKSDAAVALRDCCLRAYDFLWQNEGFDLATVVLRSEIKVFTGTPVKRTYGGRIPKEGGDAFYTHLIAHLPISTSAIDVKKLKNIMVKWRDDEELDRNLYSDSIIKRRIEGLVLAIRDQSRLQLEIDN